MTSVSQTQRVWRGDVPASVDICIPFFKTCPAQRLCDDGTLAPDLTARVSSCHGLS